MKKYLIVTMFLFSIAAFGNIPERVSLNIEREATTQDNRNLYIRTQERAYNRIISLGKKEGLTLDKLENEIIKFEKRFGTDYEVIYKHFYYDIKKVAKEQKEIEKNIEINEASKKEYNKILEEVKIPLEVRDYIEKTAVKKHPTN
ncbi:MAG: hypothetical protein ACRC5F_08420, partial [Cetobacterium sp.]